MGQHIPRVQNFSNLQICHIRNLHTANDPAKLATKFRMMTKQSRTVDEPSPLSVRNGDGQSHP